MLFTVEPSLQYRQPLLILNLYPFSHFFLMCACPHYISRIQGAVFVVHIDYIIYTNISVLHMHVDIHYRGSVCLSAVNSTDCFCRGPWFDSQPSTWGLTTICNFSCMASDAFLWPLQAPGVMHRHACKHDTHVHK